MIGRNRLHTPSWATAALLGLTGFLLVSGGCSLEAPVEETPTTCELEFLSGGTSGREIRDTAAGVGALLAQSFVLDTTTSVDQIEVMLEKNGSPTGTIIATIETNSGNLPAGALATSSSVFASSISSSSATEFTFSSPVVLSAGARYWVVLEVSYAASSTNNITWTGSTTDLNADGFGARTDTADNFVAETLIEDYTLGVECD